MSSKSSNDLTPTSFAMLGLLAIKPWTTYELAQQMRRSVSWFWPRAERKLYDEPKRLVALGLATSRTEQTGKRSSTVYEISPQGAVALRAWMGTTTFAAPQIEMEGMIRLFFAENGTPEEMVTTMAHIGADARAALTEIHAMCSDIVADPDGFPDRRATNAVTVELFVRLHETIRDWSTWAEAEVSTWPTVRRRRRSAAIGPTERGTELFTSIVRRTRTSD